jgi:hypothetical protein
MALDMGKLNEKLMEFLESEAGQESLKDFARNLERQDRAAAKVDSFLQTLDYEARLTLLKKASSKHTERWNDTCYANGFEPYPWQIINVTFRAAEIFGTLYEDGALDKFDESFGAFTKEYLGFYFNWIYGQGTVLRIFDKDKQEVFSI